MLGGLFQSQSKQDICVLAEINNAMDERLTASATHVENTDTAEAWGLDSKQQARDEKTGRYIQFVHSLCCDSVQIYKNPATPKIKTNTSLIAAQTEDQEMVYIDTGNTKSSALLWVGICLALLTLTFCVIAFISVRGG